MATVKKTSRNYVNSVLDAAAMASRADTLDGMLSQLPGLLMEQDQQKRAEATEAERYNEQMDLQRQARIDNKNREEEAADYQFLNVAVGIDDPIERAAMIAGYSPKTDRGRMGFDSLSASNAVVTGVDSNINASMKELNDEKANLSAEEYNARVLELENEINKSTYLQNKYKTGLKSYKDFGIKISGREYANELVDSNIFNITDEEKKELKETIQFSSNPVEDITVLLDKLDTKEMTEKEYASAISDLGNTAAQLENAGDTAGAATVRAYQNRIISQSSGSISSSTIDNVNTFELDDDEISAFKKAGKPDFFTVPAGSERPGQVIDYDLVNGTTNYRDVKPGEDLTVKAVKPTSTVETLKTLRKAINDAQSQEDYVAAKKALKDFQSKDSSSSNIMSYRDRQRAENVQEQTSSRALTSRF